MIDSFLMLLQPLTFLIILLSTAIGIILGAIPGLSGGLGVALLLPVTFGMPSEVGLAMLVSIWVGGVSGGLIGSILLGIPGSPSSIATTFDGYPMTRNGQAVKALGAGITASFVGTVLSILIAMFLSPILARLALKLGPWEYFSLGFCAISLVAALSRGSIFLGMASAGLGLLLSTIGFAPIDGYPRFTFGSIYLGGGLDLIALMLGLFALKQVVADYARGQQQVPEIDMKDIRGFGVSLREYRDNAWNIIRSFFIGLWIGFLPGMGAGLSNMVAYAQAKSASRHPEQFGKGCIDGVFASETSNNASVGGSLIPMVALGIPGDGTTAILLGGLMIHGISGRAAAVHQQSRRGLCAVPDGHDLGGAGAVAAIFRDAVVSGDPEDPLSLSLPGGGCSGFRGCLRRLQHGLQLCAAAGICRSWPDHGSLPPAGRSLHPRLHPWPHA